MSGGRTPRVGLVLGAGGVLGGAWLTGALHAIASETGWDPGSADHIVGTSAGSMIGALVASGVPPWFMVAHSAGETFEGVTDARGGSAADADRSAGATFKIDRAGLGIGPGSLRLGVASLTHPFRYTPMAVLSGWLPRGIISTEPLKDTVRRACADDWAPHPNYWAMAVDYRTGRRVALGRSGSPPAKLPDAVAASCAIPGFYCSVEIGGRRYVDGGVYSPSNLDVLRAEPLDLVLALNPMSSRDPGTPRSLAQRAAFSMRQANGRRLGHEAKRLREAGIEVHLLQPTGRDLGVMGGNLMSSKRRHEVIEMAIETTTDALRHSELAARLAELPAGDPRLVHRPPGPPSSWPDFRAAARERWVHLEAA
ncbi:MAG TPA: patatin-like phospholipase family protein [Solirubrobacteraceae bacterium]|nr:patatin-like phospholipase family protein [Solirubrobacteraceae bacterium]